MTGLSIDLHEFNRMSKKDREAVIFQNIIEIKSKVSKGAYT